MQLATACGYPEAAEYGKPGSSAWRTTGAQRGRGRHTPATTKQPEPGSKKGTLQQNHEARPKKNAGEKEQDITATTIGMLHLAGHGSSTHCNKFDLFQFSKIFYQCPHQEGQCCGGQHELLTWQVWNVDVRARVRIQQ